MNLNSSDGILLVFGVYGFNLRIFTYCGDSLFLFVSDLGYGL